MKQTLWITSFANILQESYRKKSGGREFAGSIRDLDTFLDPKNLDSLEAAHGGFFCFAVFHPKVDLSIKAYLESGSAASDSGTYILVLFLVGSSVPTARASTPTDLDFGIDFDRNEHPSARLADEFFPEETPTQLPGLIFSESVNNPGDSVFVPLSGLESLESVAQTCRAVFRLCQLIVSRDQERGKRLDQLAVQLSAKGIPYRRNGKRTFREILNLAFRFAVRHRGDVATAVSLV